jgi:hypothetical protein
MSNEIFDQVTIAIGAHRQWKHRLQAAIDNGQSDLSPAVVCQDNQCDFGKWLYRLPLATRASNNWKEVQKLHAAFHQEAAQVLNLALQGNRTEAAKRMAFGGSFAAASATLTQAMMKWKTATAA